MKPRENAALDAEAAERHEGIRPCGLPVPDNAARAVDVGELGLQDVKAVG